MLKHFTAVVLGALCLCSGSCDRVRKQQQEREALREMKSSKDEVLDSMTMTEEGLTVDMEKVKQAQQTLQKSGDKIGGKAGESIKMIAELQGKLNLHAQKCIEAADEAIPFFDMEALSKTRDYASGIGKFKNLISVNEETLAAFEAFRPEVTKRMDEIGFTGKDRNDFERGFERKWGRTYELVKVIRNSDIDLGKSGLALMEGLQKGDDQWDWDTEDQSITFKNDTQIEWFEAHMSRIEELGKTQSQAQQDLIQHLKAR